MDPDRVTAWGVKAKRSRRVDTLKTMNVGVVKAGQKTTINKKNVEKTLAAENGVQDWLVHFCLQSFDRKVLDAPKDLAAQYERINIGDRTFLCSTRGSD